MKKFCVYLLIIAYVWTAQLTVHNFAIHGWTTHEGMSPCWHSSNTWEQNSHDMAMCLEQSMWAFVSDTPTLYTTLHLPTIFTTSTQAFLQEYTHIANHIEDPWWDTLHWNFSHFRQQLYGHGIVMHC